MASQNEASIWVSSAPIAARNTPRSRCSSAQQERAQIFQPLLPPRLLPQELQRYDPLDVKLQPLVSGNMAGPAPHRLPESLLFRARSTEYLPLCHRKRCAPSRGEWLLELANTQNCDAWRVQSNPTPSDPLQQDYAQGGARPAAQSSAMANAFISFSSFASEIASVHHRVARGDLSEMPLGHGLIAQTADDWRMTSSA